MSQASVLVIEDDLVFQKLVHRYLQQLNYDVFCTDSGQAALKLCQQRTPDIVICDLKLPDISGLDVIEALLSMTADLPIVVVSASDSMSDIREAVRLGAWDYLVKPLENLTALNEAIQHCLKRYELEETFLHDRWELDDHIEVLYNDDSLVQRLTNELIPNGPLQLGGYCFDYHLQGEPPRIWLDYRPLLSGKVLVIMASPQSATDQALIPLLVFKTLLDPLLRQHLSGTDDKVLRPNEVLQHMNSELCHSRIRAAFDVWIGVLDTQQQHWQWAQAGDRIHTEPHARPDLALGIWQRARYHCNDAAQRDKVHAWLPQQAEIMVQREPLQIDE